MSKVAFILNYAIYSMIVLFVAKLYGLGNDTKAMMIVIALSTVFYVVFMTRRLRKK